DIDAGDDHCPIARPYFLDSAALAAVLTGDDHHLVALPKAHATSHLQDLRCERNDLHEVALAKLTGHGAEDTGPARLVLRIQENRRVVVETDHRAVGAAVFLRLPHDDRAHDLALLDAGVRDGVLHRGDEDIADLGGRPGGRRQHADDRELTSPGVVRATDPGVRPDHSSAFSSVSCSSSSRSGVRMSVTPSCSSSAFSMSAPRGAAAPASPAREITSPSRQRFLALNGRLSWMPTRSPALASPASSCAAKRLRRRIIFL